MSGTGKSTALVELAGRGFRVVDMDTAGWSEWMPVAREWLWREDRMAELLAAEEPGILYVSGCASNQGRFYDRFDAVVLLSATTDVILDRIERRTTNDYGKGPGERERILSDLVSVEPLLRATCTHEIDASMPIEDVVDALVAVGRDAQAAPCASRKATTRRHASSDASA
jgi:dephospho-CoA kinase